MAPDLFKCAIGVVGVYDLSLMYKEGDIKESVSGKDYLKHVIGTNAEVLDKFSPAKNAEKIMNPVLIVHGGEDQRVPIEHAERLIEALEKHDKKYEYMEFENEGHGFYKPKHRLKYYEKVLEFLNKHLDS